MVISTLKRPLESSYHDIFRRLVMCTEVMFHDNRFASKEIEITFQCPKYAFPLNILICLPF